MVDGVLEEDDDGIMDQGDPIAALIDRIDSVKASFEAFSKGLKEEGLADDDDEDVDQLSSPRGSLPHSASWP